MKLTESQIRQIVQSSIEAKKPAKTHRLTENELRHAIRHHIKTGQPLNEGIFSAIKDALADVAGAFIDGFKSVFGEAQGALKASSDKVKSEISAAIGGEFPDMENLDPAASDNDKLGIVIYMGGYKQEAKFGLDRLKEVDPDTNPYPNPDNPDIVSASANQQQMSNLSASAGWFMGILDRLSIHIPEARSAMKSLEAATGKADPLEIAEGMKEGVSALTDTIMPQLQEMAALADKAPDALKSEVQERAFALEDMQGYFEEANSSLDKVISNFTDFKAESEEEAEEAMEEAGEDPEEEGTEGEEPEGEGEEGSEVPAVAFGEEGAEQDDGNEEEEKKNESAFSRHGMVISEAKLRKIIRRSLVSHKNKK